MNVSGARIELWVEERGGRPAVNPVMRTLLDGLISEGAEVSVRVPEREVVEAAGNGDRLPDLALLKSATTLALSRAVSDEARGGRFLNGAGATLRAHDKATTVARLAAAGLTVPETYLFESGAGLRGPIVPDGGWVTKPTRGVHGRGVVLHEDVSSVRTGVAALEAEDSFVVDDGTRLLQRRMGGDEPDLKTYVAGERCYAGRKRFSATSYAADDIEVVEPEPELERIILSAGAALGLRCFGVDLRFDNGEPFIVDVNPFPGYRGFPEAVEALRAEVERALEEREVPCP